MRYEMMLPGQIRAAIDGRWPVVLPLGVLEYHGEHMAVGMDTLAVIGILGILETEMNLVVLPPFHCGAASYPVEPPENSGSLHIDAEALLPFAKAMFQRLLRIGFRNIHVVIHHQTETFAAGMPNSAIEPRIPGIFQYCSIAEDELQKTFAGKETAQQGADNIAAAWEKLTDKLGRENQVKYYRIAMGLVA